MSDSTLSRKYLVFFYPKVLMVLFGNKQPFQFHQEIWNFPVWPFYRSLWFKVTIPTGIKFPICSISGEELRANFGLPNFSHWGWIQKEKALPQKGGFTNFYRWFGVLHLNFHKEGGIPSGGIEVLTPKF